MQHLLVISGNLTWPLHFRFDRPVKQDPVQVVVRDAAAGDGRRKRVDAHAVMTVLADRAPVHSHLRGAVRPYARICRNPGSPNERFN